MVMVAVVTTVMTLSVGVTCAETYFAHNSSASNKYSSQG